MRRGAGGGAEVAGQREAVEPGHFLQLLRRHGTMRLGRQELAGAVDGAMGGGGALGPWAIVAARGEACGQALDDGVDGQRLERPREIGEGLAQQVGQFRIVGHHLGHEGWACTLEGGRHRGGVDVEHAVGEAGIDRGMAIMRFVGMDHHDLAAAAGLQGAAIVEGLRAPQGEADAIGLVAMQVVGVAAEARRQPGQAGRGFVEADLVGGGHAQTFKTAGSLCPIWRS